MNKTQNLGSVLAFGALLGSALMPVNAGKLDTGILDTGVTEASKFKYRLDLRGGYDSRASTGADGEDQGSPFSEINVGVSRRFGGARTSLDFDLSGGTNYFWDVDNDDTDINLRLELGLSHRISRRADLTFTSLATYQVEPDFFSGTGRSSRSGQYLYTNNALQLGMVWTRRFSTVTSYSFVAVRYDDEEFAAVEDRFEHYFANEFRYLVLPTTTLVAEYRLGIVEYDSNPQSSISHFALGGVDYQMNRRTSITLRGGAEFREFDSGASTEAPYGEATISYAYGEGSTISWITRYGLEQSEITGPLSNTSLRTGIQVNHKLTGKLSGRLGLYYQNTDFDNLEPDEPIIDPFTGEEVPSTYDPAYSEDLIDVAAGLSYRLNKNISLDLGYSFTTVSSDQPINEYDRHRVFFGVSANF